MRLKTILAITILFLIEFTYAQDSTLSLNLNEAIEYALEKNKVLNNARADIAVQDKNISVALSSGLPQVSANMDYMTYFGYEMEFNLGGDTEMDPSLIMDAIAQTQATYPNWTADKVLDYQAEQAFEQTLQGMMPSTGIKMTDQLTGNIQVGQLLFNGQFFIGVQTAKLAKTLAEQSVKSVEYDTKENVTNSYYLVLITEKTLEIIDQNVADLNDILKQTEGMYRAGVVEETDVDQIKIQLIMLENTRRSMERSVQLNYNLLRFQLGTAPNAEIKLTQSLSDFLNDDMANINPEAQFNIEDNITYQLAESQTVLMDKMVNMEKWAYGPTITGFYNYNAKILTSGFDMNPNHAAGASLSLPIFNGFEKRAKVSKAKIELDKALTTQSMVVDQLVLQEQQLRFELRNAIENYLSQKENVEVAKRVFNSFNRKYTHGTASSLDLTQANSNYLQTETNFVQAQMTLLQADLKLKKLLNSL